MPKIISIKEYCEKNGLTDLLAQYAPDNPVPAERIGYTFKREVKWICAHGHVEIESPFKRFRRGYCKTCGKNKGGSFAQQYPDFVRYWAKDNTVTADEVPPTYSKPIKWACEKGHTWERRICDQLAAASVCPICKSEENALFTVRPDLLSEWDEVGNNHIDPSSVAYMSSQPYKWICKHGHSFEATPAERCRRHKNCPTCNSFGFKYPDAASEWHPVKNDFTPTDVSASSNKTAWFICKQCGEDYLSIIKDRAKRVSKNCPHCR